MSPKLVLDRPPRPEHSIQPHPAASLRRSRALSSRRSARSVGSRPTEAELIRIFLDRGIRDFVSVPCSVTDTWHDLAAREAQAGRLDLVMTSHEGNLAGIAGGVWLGTGRPALVHMQNSGLTNAADGFISFADPTVFGIPLLALVTYRGATPEDRSEPHQAIGRRTESLVDSVFGPSATIAGERSGRALRSAAERAADAARDGGVGVVKIAEAGLAKVEQAQLRDPVTSPNVPARSALRMFKGAGSCPSELTDDAACASQRSRDDAIRTIAARHPDAALLFSNGFTSRAARATVDHARCFYNIGYMGGTLAIGWGLARSRPDLEVVVVDGDQNALMSGMKDQLAAEYPPNLHWYILDNGIGASVGTSESIPLAPWFGDLARIVRTRPDPPGSFSHPRVAAPRPGEALRSLAERFRNHLSV